MSKSMDSNTPRTAAAAKLSKKAERMVEARKNLYWAVINAAAAVRVHAPLGGTLSPDQMASELIEGVNNPFNSDLREAEIAYDQACQKYNRAWIKHIKRSSKSNLK